MDETINDDLGRISTEMIRSLNHEELADLGATMGDIALDGLISSGAMDGVPVLGAVVSIARSGRAVRDLVFQRKVVAFLVSFASGSDPSSRQKFVRNIETKDDGHRFGETILLLLERMDDLSKPAIVGRLMAAAAREDLSLAEAMRISRIVDRAFVEDLQLLPDFVDDKVQPDEAVADALFSAGLLRNGGISGGGPDEPGGIFYARNRYAQLLVKFGLADMS
ncbi:hypothetical protein [Rhizobium leguminosarum]|uniref:hypothetical protein n=1 Tax=Rhizobium leguminosarum TaxID=384 RepID=UPI001FDFB7B3|nr:hypothetical protein [Rhizobium leguminosarum]